MPELPELCLKADENMVLFLLAPAAPFSCLQWGGSAARGLVPVAQQSRGCRQELCFQKMMRDAYCLASTVLAGYG